MTPLIVFNQQIITELSLQPVHYEMCTTNYLSLLALVLSLKLWRRANGETAARHDKVDLSNLDRWYESDAGERIGDFTLYRVKLRR